MFERFFGEKAEKITTQPEESAPLSQEEITAQIDELKQKSFELRFDIENIKNQVVTGINDPEVAKEDRMSVIKSSGLGELEEDLDKTEKKIEKLMHLLPVDSASDIS